MGEHRIQLRRAWNGVRGATSSLVTLPALWREGEVPDRLSRRFQRPSGLGPDDALSIELEDVSGLESATLNGADLGPISEERCWLIPITGLDATSFLLEFFLDPTRVAWDRAWGRVALVIRSASGEVGRL